jgi:membrane protein
LPPGVAERAQKPITTCWQARDRLAAVAWRARRLWTVGSFIETIRDILRRAYGTIIHGGFWHYRMGSLAMIVDFGDPRPDGFSAQIFLTAIEEFVTRLLPFAGDVSDHGSAFAFARRLVLSGALRALLLADPLKYRYSKCPKWPGACSRRPGGCSRRWRCLVISACSAVTT